MAGAFDVPLSRVTNRFRLEMTFISSRAGGHWAGKSCMIRPFPCVGLAPTQTGQGAKGRARDDI